MKFIIKRLPVWPVAKITFVICFILSLVGFLFYSMFLTSFLSGIASLVDEELAGLPALTGGAVFIGGFFMSIFSSIISTIVVILGVLLYNGLSSLVGGIEMEVDKVEDFVSYAPRSVESPQVTQQDSIPPTMDNKDNEPPVHQG